MVDEPPRTYSLSLPISFTEEQAKKMEAVQALIEKYREISYLKLFAQVYGETPAVKQRLTELGYYDGAEDDTETEALCPSCGHTLDARLGVLYPPASPPTEDTTP